jgi:hypothetical protein
MAVAGDWVGSGIVRIGVSAARLLLGCAVVHRPQQRSVGWPVRRLCDLELRSDWRHSSGW